MDFKFIKTDRGATMSIHCGKIVSTNMIGGRWLTIIDEEAKEIIRKARNSLNWCRTLEDEQNLRNSTIEQLNALGRPYFELKNDKYGTGAVSFGSSASAPITEVVSEIKTTSFDGKDIKERLEKTLESLVSKKPEEMSEEEITTKVKELEGLKKEIEQVELTPEILNLRREVSQKILDFFSEFQFVPAARFVNTLSKQSSYDGCKNFINNYMNLIDHPDKNEINEKIKSDEFKYICKDLIKLKTDKQINKRLEILFGPAGTGKTTELTNNYPDAKITVCNELMDSDSIMKVFDFTDEEGHPVFKPSQLQLDMIAGRPHILDEINLLPMNTLRFLQGILDGKDHIDYEGRRIDIKEGFKIVATMNLVVNGQTFALPEPIVDRAYKLKAFESNKELLSKYAF